MHDRRSRDYILHSRVTVNRATFDIAGIPGSQMLNDFSSYNVLLERLTNASVPVGQPRLTG